MKGLYLIPDKNNLEESLKLIEENHGKCFSEKIQQRERNNQKN